MKYFNTKVMPELTTGLRKVIELYQNKLNYDITKQVGVTKSKKDEAKELLKDGCISEDTYKKLLALELSIDHFEKESSDKDKKVVVSQYGYLVEPSKERMGLLDLGIEEE